MIAYIIFAIIIIDDFEISFQKRFAEEDIINAFADIAVNRKSFEGAGSSRADVF